MARKKQNKLKQSEASMLNDTTYVYYYNWLKLISLNVFKYENVPSTIDVRFLELTLFERGTAVYFNDDELGNLSLPATLSGKYDTYGIPTDYYAYASNGYKCSDIDKNNSVLIFNNYLRDSSEIVVQLYARKLANLDRTIDVNVSAQRTPIMVTCSEQQKMTMMNLVMQYDGNEPYIFVDSKYAMDGLQVFQTVAPYVADKVEALKHSLLNDFLATRGIENSNEDKKERMVSDEVNSNYGIVEVNRNISLTPRQEAFDKINVMFNIEPPIKVSFNSDVKTLVNQFYNEVGEDIG